MPNIGVPELLIVLIIALIVLGPKKLPEVGRSLGRGMREFKDSISGITETDDDDDETPAIGAAPTTTTASSTPASTASPTEQSTPS